MAYTPHVYTYIHCTFSDAQACMASACAGLCTSRPAAYGMVAGTMLASCLIELAPPTACNAHFERVWIHLYKAACTQKRRIPALYTGPGVCAVPVSGVCMLLARYTNAACWQRMLALAAHASTSCAC